LPVLKMKAVLMNKEKKILELAKKIQALAETGKHYSLSDYDTDRYTDIEKASAEIISQLGGGPVKKIMTAIKEDNGYKTPKVDVRAVILNEKNEILMVREKIDDRWSLPGGWADIGYTPAEVAVKETYEEAGMAVRAGELLAVLDKKCHSHPPDIYYIYKIFIRCYPLDNTMKNGYETTDVRFFSQNNLPGLSEPRNTRDQIDMMFSQCRQTSPIPVLD